MSLVKQVGLLLVVLAGGAALWFADVPALFARGGEASRPSTQSAGAQRTIPVVVQPVQMAFEATVVQAPGTGIADKSVTLYPESAGRVTEILFEAGQKVAKDAPLLRLDTRAEQLAVQLARVHVKEAKRKLDRMQQLAPRGNVPRAELELAETELSAAEITLAQREYALRERTLFAPFDGVTGIPGVDPGERVDEDRAVATLDDRSLILVDFDVPEAYARGVAIGGKVEITAWATGARDFEGRIRSVASQIDPDTRTLRVRATVPNTEDVLRPGMSFVVRMPIQGGLYPSVPSVAVQWNRQGAFVWRVVEGKAERVPVKILKRSDVAVLVDAPLDDGALVVVEGVQRLRDRALVRIVQSEEEGGGGA